MSFVGRFVLFRRLFCTECILEYILCVLCWEVFEGFTILPVKYLFFVYCMSMELTLGGRFLVSTQCCGMEV